MAFQNVNLDYQNISFGPDSGRVYSIDHTTDSMIVKTYPAGTLVTTLPLDVPLQNEVLSLDYDGYYFWTQVNAGGPGSNLGTIINKWLIQNSTLVKQLGPGCEIVLPNSATNIYDSEAMTVQSITTKLNFTVSSGSSSAVLNDVTFLSIGDAIYFGPSSAASLQRQERVVTGISGNTVFFNTPVTIQFNVNDSVTYRKNIWVFNNRNGIDANSGSLIQVSSYDGTIQSVYSSNEWKGVTAACSNNGNLAFIRGSQLLQYRPFGTNAGYQSSAFLNNIKTDNSTTIKAYDMIMDASNVYKLQLTQHLFNTTTLQYEDTDSANGKYQVDSEILASKVMSITAIRDKSILFGASSTANLTVIVKDQYDIPVFNRSMTVQENDASGFITPGMTSFVTNVSGIGNTRYDSGVNSNNFSQPLVTVIDVGTLLRLNTLLEQFSYKDSKAVIEQYGNVTNTLPVEQRTVTGTTILEQYGATTNAIPLEQTSLQGAVPVVQQTVSNSLPIEQQAAASATFPVDQSVAISGTVNVIQYDFLVFAVPTPYSVKNATNTSILVRIVGFGATPLNPSTVNVKINGVDVTGSVILTNFGGGLQIDYDPPVDFDYSSTVTVEIAVSDTNLPPRTVTTKYTFDVVSDYRKPYLYEAYPPDNSIENLPSTEVYAIISDQETGVDLDTIEMYIEGRRVSTVVTSLGSGLVKVSHQTAEPYPYESDIFASVFAEDNEGNSFVGSWNFKTSGSSGVLFTNIDPGECDVLIPIDTNVCIEAFGLKDGINLESTNFHVDGKTVNFVLKSKVYRTD